MHRRKLSVKKCANDMARPRAANHPVGTSVALRRVETASVIRLKNRPLPLKQPILDLGVVTLWPLLPCSQVKQYSISAQALASIVFSRRVQSDHPVE